MRLKRGCVLDLTHSRSSRRVTPNLRLMLSKFLFSCSLRISKKLVNIALVQDFSVSVIFTLRSDTFHHGGCRMRNVYQYPGSLLEEMPVATFLVVAIKNIFRRWQMSSGWQNHPELGITALSL